MQGIVRLRLNDFFVYRKDSFWLVLVVSLYCLHVLRHIFPIYAVLAPMLSMLAAGWLFNRSAKLNASGMLCLGCFVFTAMLPLVYSYLWYPDEEYLTPSLRYFYLLPFLLFSIVVVDSKRLVIIALRVIVFFVVLGACTIFYQVAFGAISWLAEPSEREGLVRFSSLLGSLTAYGVYGGLALPLAFFLLPKGLVRLTATAVIIVALLMTLQKAAVVNVLLFLMLAFYIGPRMMKLSIAFGVSVGLLAIIIAYALEFNYVVATIDNVFRLRPQAGASDVALLQSMLDRVWELPSHLYTMHGFWGMTLGVGLVGGSGTLGFSNYPMAHNGFFDLLYIGGALNLFCFLFLFCFVMYRLRLFHKAVNDDVSGSLYRASFCALIMFFVNFLFAGVLYFQPYGGLVFYLLVSFFCFRYMSSF